MRATHDQMVNALRQVVPGLPNVLATLRAVEEPKGKEMTCHISYTTPDGKEHELVLEEKQFEAWYFAIERVLARDARP